MTKRGSLAGIAGSRVTVRALVNATNRPESARKDASRASMAGDASLVGISLKFQSFKEANFQIITEKSPTDC